MARTIKLLLFNIVLCVFLSNTGFSADTTVVSHTAKPTSGYTYNYMYPYLNNQMKTTLNPGGATSQSTSPINTIVKTTPIPGTTQRRIVSRAGTTNKKNDSTTNIQQNPKRNIVPRQSNSSVARSAQTQQFSQSTQSQQKKRVIARSGTTSRTTNPIQTISYENTSNQSTTTTVRCLADYTECMNRYCEREQTLYNRCYCSSKLAQIDAKYKPEIDKLIMQIAKLQGETYWTDEEMNEYWNEKIGVYTGDNSWVNLDNTLNIDWTSLESRVRGQNAFITGHEYCSQHLSGCFYSSSNLRDAYRSEIAQDCAAYEQNLIKIKNAAESFIEMNQ